MKEQSGLPALSVVEEASQEQEDIDARGDESPHEASSGDSDQKHHHSRFKDFFRKSKSFMHHLGHIHHQHHDGDEHHKRPKSPLSEHHENSKDVSDHRQRQRPASAEAAASVTSPKSSRSLKSSTKRQFNGQRHMSSPPVYIGSRAVSSPNVFGRSASADAAPGHPSISHPVKMDPAIGSPPCSIRGFFGHLASTATSQLARSNEALSSGVSNSPTPSNQQARAGDDDSEAMSRSGSSESSEHDSKSTTSKRRHKDRKTKESKSKVKYRSSKKNDVASPHVRRRSSTLSSSTASPASPALRSADDLSTCPLTGTTVPGCFVIYAAATGLVLGVLLASLLSHLKAASPAPTENVDMLHHIDYIHHLGVLQGQLMASASPRNTTQLQASIRNALDLDQYDPNVEISWERLELAAKWLAASSDRKEVLSCLRNHLLSKKTGAEFAALTHLTEDDDIVK